MQRFLCFGSAVVSMAVLTMLAPCSAMGHAFVVDQSSEGLPFGGYAISTETGNTIGQEFTPTFSALDVVEIGLGPRDPSSFGLRVNIRAGALDGSIVGTSLLAIVQGGPVPPAVIHFDFSSPVPLTPGNLYVIQPILEPSSAPVGFPFLDPAPYAGGRALIHGQIRNDIDIIFRTGLTVPEPAVFNFVIVATGLLMIWPSRRLARPTEFPSHKMRAACCSVFAGTISMFALNASPALAIPLFTANAQLASNGIVYAQQSNMGNLQAGAEVNDPSGRAMGSALATYAGLRAHGFGRINNGSLGGGGSATARYGDFIIQGPAGPVTTSFNMFLSGNLTVLSNNIPETSNTAHAVAWIDLIVNDVIVTGDPFFRDQFRYDSTNGVLETRATGMFRNWRPAFGTITTPSFTVNAGEPFSLEITLRASAGATGFNQHVNTFSAANSDFGNTLSFATTGPVFNLPAGYTVNSADARINENQFVVPEPAALALVLVAAAVVGFTSTRRRGKLHPRCMYGSFCHGGVSGAIILFALACSSRQAFGIAADNFMEPSGFSDLITHPKDFASWDGTNITWKFDSNFLAAYPHPYLHDQVRLAFQEWDRAFSTANGTSYSYYRADGVEKFFDMRSLTLHEIGHVLGLDHPDQAADVGRNYGPGTPLVAKADQDNEVMRSYLNRGDYNHVLSHDELDAFRYMYGRDLNFTEVSGATPAQIVISTYHDADRSRGARANYMGESRSGTDPRQGLRTTSGLIEFNTNSIVPNGMKTLAMNWGIQDSVERLVTRIELRTHGTNNLFPIDFSPGRFEDFSSSGFGNNSKDDLLITWSDIPILPVPPIEQFSQIGLELDVHDWTVVSADAFTFGGAQFKAPLVSAQSWHNTAVQAGMGAAATGDGVRELSLFQVLASGIRLANSDTLATMTAIGLSAVDDLRLNLDDLNRATLSQLNNDDRLTLLDFDSILLDPAGDFYLVLDGGVDDLPPELQARGNYMLLDRPDLVGKELFVYVESQAGDLVVENYALLGRAPIVPEPATCMLVLLGAGVVMVCRMRFSPSWA